MLIALKPRKSYLLKQEKRFVRMLKQPCGPPPLLAAGVSKFHVRSSEYSKNGITLWYSALGAHLVVLVKIVQTFRSTIILPIFR